MKRWGYKSPECQLPSVFPCFSLLNMVNTVPKLCKNAILFLIWRPIKEVYANNFEPTISVLVTDYQSKNTVKRSQPELIKWDFGVWSSSLTESHPLKWAVSTHPLLYLLFCPLLLCRPQNWAGCQRGVLPQGTCGCGFLALPSFVCKTELFKNTFVGRKYFNPTRKYFLKKFPMCKIWL